MRSNPVRLIFVLVLVGAILFLIISCNKEPRIIMPVITEYPGTSLSAVKIGSVWWAPINAGYDASHQYGLLYQWGRKYGQEYVTTGAIYGPVTAGIGNDINNKNMFYIGSSRNSYDWCSPHSSVWDMTLYNPCPSGWRVPTSSEFSELYYTGSTWVDKGGIDLIPGRWFGGDHNGSHVGSIFLPAFGYRVVSLGSLDFIGRYGNYWTTTTFSDAYGYYLNFGNKEVKPDLTTAREYGFAVRCVRGTIGL